jgi:hypothetical protein
MQGGIHDRFERARRHVAEAKRQKARGRRTINNASPSLFEI